MKLFAALIFSSLVSLACFLSGLAFSSQAHAQTKPAPQVLAEVGSKVITVEDFNKKYQEVKTQTFGGGPTKSQFLEDLVRYEIGVQEAEKRKISQDPRVQESLRQALYRGLLEIELGDKVQSVKVTDKEMEAFYKKNPEIRFSHILIEVKPGATAEQRAEAQKRAEDIWKEVKASKRPFEELVRLYTDDTVTKQLGGDAGWQSPVTVLPHVYSTLHDMKIGEVKGLTETQYGFHILKVTGRRSYESANKRTIRAAVFDDKRKELFNEYFDKVKRSYKINVNKKLIE